MQICKIALMDGERDCALWQQRKQENWLKIFKIELHKTHPIEADVLQKNCIYRCGCPEFKSCGYWETFCKKHQGENLLDIQNRYDLANKDFYEQHK